MHANRLLVVVIAGSLIAAPAGAQSGGTVELGGFGQFTKPDNAWVLKSGWGGGGRLGVFLNHRWELEATAAAASLDNKTPSTGSTSAQTYSGQINYNIPFAGRNQFLLEAGAGDERIGGQNNFAIPLGLGLRFLFNDVVGLRFDGIAQYVPSVNGLPATSSSTSATNIELRAGLSFLLGNHHAPPPPPPPAPTPAPPPRREEPPPPPRRVEPPAPNTDSLNRVARDRDALTAAVYFDFDKSVLRDDQRAVLDAKLPVLRNNPSIRIRIEGNADERGSDEYNLALGQRRAETAKKYLVDNGIDAGRIDITSNGEERPVCQEHEESCWSRNRRDEFVIVVGDIR